MDVCHAVTVCEKNEDRPLSHEIKGGAGIRTSDSGSRLDCNAHIRRSLAPARPLSPRPGDARRLERTVAAPPHRRTWERPPVACGDAPAPFSTRFFIVCLLRVFGVVSDAPAARARLSASAPALAPEPRRGPLPRQDGGAGRVRAKRGLGPRRPLTYPWLCQFWPR